MPHEIDKAALTAHLDGRGTPETAAHVASCTDCASYLERVRKASALFKAHGRVSAPATKQKESWVREVALIVTICAATVLVSGWVLKRYMPGMFSQIQGMISGAANNLGR